MKKLQKVFFGLALLGVLFAAASCKNGNDDDDSQEPGIVAPGDSGTEKPEQPDDEDVQEPEQPGDEDVQEPEQPGDEDAVVLYLVGVDFGNWD